jgi:hypothetical protein
MKIYVASSWRNPYQPKVVEELRKLGHEVYDFRNPRQNDRGFHWSEIDPLWEYWTPEEYVNGLNHPIAESGFKSDFDAMKWADCCIMVLPCGRSANTEAGWMKGAGKQVHVFMPITQEPELMYKIYDSVITSFEQLSAISQLKEQIKKEGTSVNLIQTRDLTDEEWLELPKEEILQLYKNCYSMLMNYIQLSGEKIEDIKTFTSTEYIPKSIFTRRRIKNQKTYDFVVKHKVAIYQNTRHYSNYTEGKNDKDLQELIEFARKEIGYSDRTWSGDIFTSLVNLYKKICV